jgi:hypothetical protein
MLDVGHLHIFKIILRYSTCDIPHAREDGAYPCKSRIWRTSRNALNISYPPPRSHHRLFFVALYIIYLVQLPADG